MDAYDPLRVSVAARVGRVLNGKWHLDALLGVGGMAAVYAATHRNTKRVAVKILHTDMAMDPGIRQRFVREGYAANRVGHPGAVDILDDDVTEDGSPFLVMELLDGENLDRRMRRKGGKLPGAEVLSIADQVLDTLAAAHDRGILHRDIKPENVFLTRSGVVKLLDFGIARVLELGSSAKVTQRGAVLGTPAFMAPEQAMATWEHVDQRSDIWAIGATLFMLLTGEFVHPVRTGMEALDHAVSKRARSVGSIGVFVHPAVVKVVDQALAFERDARFQTAREMQQAVRTAYVELEGDSRMAELSMPDPEPPAKQDSGATAPSDHPASATPLPGATTIVSKRNAQRRFVGTVAAALALTAAAGILALVMRGPEEGAPAAVSATPKTATAPAASVVTSALSETTRLRELPASSAQLVVPVVAVSALPAEATPTATTVAPSARPRPVPVHTSAAAPVTAPPVAAAPAPAPSAPQAPATTAKPSEETDPFSGRF